MIDVHVTYMYGLLHDTVIIQQIIISLWQNWNSKKKIQLLLNT